MAHIMHPIIHPNNTPKLYTQIPNPTHQEAFLSAVEAEVADLRAAVATAQNAAGDAEAQAAKLNDQFLRLTADFDNFRKRTVCVFCMCNVYVLCMCIVYVACVCVCVWCV